MQNIRGTAGTALLVLGLATALCLMRSSHLDGCQGGCKGALSSIALSGFRGPHPLHACVHPHRRLTAAQDKNPIRGEGRAGQIAG